MLRKIGYGVVTLLVLALGYVGFALARGSAVPGLPFPSVQRALAQAITRHDSAAPAAAAAPPGAALPVPVVRAAHGGGDQGERFRGRGRRGRSPLRIAGGQGAPSLL